MLFELHDIILHRLWKWRKAKYDAFMKNAVCLDSLKTIMSDARRCKRLGDLERLTRRWYMNHVRKSDMVYQ